MPEYAVLAYTSTIHKSIADTVRSNIYIIEDRNSSVWCNNGLYTACSRCQYMSQLKLVQLPQHIREQAHTNTYTLEVQIVKRIVNHTKADLKANRDTDITPEYVLTLLKDATHCPHCDTQLKLTNYYDRDSDAWSIDRINNKLGHVIGNCWITCYTCNIHHFQ